MSTAIPGIITAARNLTLNPRVAEQAASVVGRTQGVLPRAGPSLDLASDAIKGISPIAMA